MYKISKNCVNIWYLSSITGLIYIYRLCQYTPPDNSQITGQLIMLAYMGFNLIFGLLWFILQLRLEFISSFYERIHHILIFRRLKDFLGINLFEKNVGIFVSTILLSYNMSIIKINPTFNVRLSEVVCSF